MFAVGAKKRQCVGVCVCLCVGEGLRGRKELKTINDQSLKGKTLQPIYADFLLVWKQGKPMDYYSLIDVFVAKEMKGA